MPKTHKGWAAQAIMQGRAPAARATKIDPKNRYDSEKGEYTKDIEAYAVDIVSPCTRYATYTVFVDAQGFKLDFDDDELEQIAEEGKDANFPYVRFENLSLTEYSKKESKEVFYSCKASGVVETDINGKPIPPQQK